jgi:hypothetical protein
MEGLTSLSQKQMSEQGLLRLLIRLREILPKGMGLSEPDWQIRHRLLLLLLWTHVLAFPLVTWTFCW